MKVKELQEMLADLDPDLELFCYSEEEQIVAEDHLFRLLSIEDVSVIEAERRRGEDRLPSFAIGKTECSEKFALLNVLAQF